MGHVKIVINLLVQSRVFIIKRIKEKGLRMKVDG